ncbi:MAG: hypothetical protein PVS2B2_27210 [Candidatus Acidiferrum sp.]
MDKRKFIAGNFEPQRPPRYAYKADLEIEWGSARLRGCTRDVSTNGMFIEAVDTLWVGAGFRARLALDRPVVVDCLVRRIEPGRGMGVTITVAPHQDVNHFHELVAALAKEIS